MQQDNSKSTALALTFLFPFVGLIYSLVNWRQSWAKNAFWLACIYLGAVFIFCPEGSVLGMGADGGRYALDLMNVHENHAGLLTILSQYWLDRGSLDLYQPLVTYIVSRFTDNAHLLFAVFAAVFGFFYSRNIWYVLERLPQKKLGPIVILVALFFLVCPITQINGVRMWTALHVFVYAMMPYLLERDRSKLWCLAIAPFIHFSYLYVSILALVYVLALGRRAAKSGFFQLVALSVFVATMFINALNLDAVGGMLSEISPAAYEGRIDMYMNQDVLDNNKQSSGLANWYISYSGIIQKWGFNILLILLYPCFKRNVKQKELLSSLFFFALLLGAFANIMALIPSGGRFQVLAKMFKLPLIIMAVMSIPQSDSFRKYVNISLFILLLPLVVEFRRIFDYYSITAVLGNFITALFWENNVPLMDVVKWLL